MNSKAKGKKKQTRADGLGFDKLCINVYGNSGAGKTNLAGSAPCQVGVIPIDPNCLNTIRRLKSINQWFDVVTPKQTMARIGADNASMFLDLRRALGDKKARAEHAKASQDESRAHLENVLDFLMDITQDDAVGTILLDTGTQLFQDVMYAHFGRDSQVWPTERSAAYETYKGIMSVLRNCEKHVIITHWEKDEYIADAPTGRKRPQGYKDMAYLVNCEMYMRRVDTKDKARKIKAEVGRDDIAVGDWVAVLEKCMMNQDLPGKPDAVFVNDEIAFPEICMRIYQNRADDLDFVRDIGYPQEQAEAMGLV